METGATMTHSAATAAIRDPLSVLDDLPWQLRCLERGDALEPAPSGATGLYRVQSGRITLSHLLPSGREVFITELGAGRVFGRLHDASTADDDEAYLYVAATASRVGVLDRASLEAMLRVRPELGLVLLEALSRRVANRTRLAVNAIGKTVPQRIHAAIRERVRGCAADARGVRMISPRPNLSALARQLNTEREIVSREISKLVRRGVLERRETGLAVLDVEGLD